MNFELWPLGMDGVDLPATEAIEWTLGGTAEVAFALLANHGGGYSYRLCPKSSKISEECFQQNTLRFHGNVSSLHYAEIFPDNRDLSAKFLELPRVAIPRKVVPMDIVHPPRFAIHAYLALGETRGGRRRYVPNSAQDST